MHLEDDFVHGRERRPLPRKQLNYRDSIDSFDDVMILHRDDAREVYLPKSSPYSDDWERRRRSRSRSSRRSRRHPHRKYDDSDSDSETDPILSSGEGRKRSKAPNKTLLVACLTTITTVAARNNIYQSTNTHQARKKQLEEGRMSLQEERDMKKGMKRDLMSLGVVAVCLNNAKNGWKRLDHQRAEACKVEEKLRKKRKHRN
ncbi:MAG: hypothetical protein Q9211_002752 [Gyalolechia sp. 1 TL-2023]